MYFIMDKTAYIITINVIKDSIPNIPRSLILEIRKD